MEAMYKGPTSVVRVEGETFVVGENLRLLFTMV